jgi:hypothetical protein
MNTSDQVDQIGAAMAAVQGSMKPAIKDATNPHFKSKYADLSAVFEAIRDPLAKNGLTVWQDLGNDEKGVTVKTRIVHKSGQWVEFGPLSIPANKNDAQGLGSAATYARRYGLSAALGVVADLDDDGNAAVQPPARSVPDAQPDKAKSAPGVSEAKNWVRDHIRELNACGDPQQLMEAIEAAKPRYVKVCGVYPSLWTGPDGTGLRGEAQKMATAYECRPAFDKFIKAVEEAAAEYQQPHKDAAE